MEYYGNNDYRDYLALQHHGILGMKWGKRNGPPYPLGASDHSAAEKKAGWRKSLGGGSGGDVKSKARKFVQSGAGGVAKAGSKVKSDRDKSKAESRAKKEEYKKKTVALAEEEARAYDRVSPKDHDAIGKIEDRYAEKAKKLHDEYYPPSPKKAAKAAYKEQKKAIKEKYKKESQKYYKEAIDSNSSLDNRALAETKMLKAGVKQRNALNKAKNEYRRSIGKKEKDYSEKNSVTTKMAIDKSDTKQTQQVKRDYNNVSDKDFFRLYGVSKKTYKKRVDQYGDPYKHALDEWEAKNKKKK